MTSLRIYLSLTLFLLLPGVSQADCQSSNQGIDSMTASEVKIEVGYGSRLTVPVYLADSYMERGYGFQYICEDVIDSMQILFVYRKPTSGKFHMQNVHANLDGAFFDREGNLIEIIDMKTYTDNLQPLYFPDTPFQYVIEARSGFFAEHHVKAGISTLLLDSLPAFDE